MTADPEGLGKRIAQQHIVRGVRPDPRELAERLGAAVAEAEAPPPAQPELRAEYRASPPQIILYRRSLALLAAVIRSTGRADLMACDLEGVHVAHELFHHLEFGGRFGPLSREEMETAAHAFAKELCGLTFNPEELSGLRD